MWAKCRGTVIKGSVYEKDIVDDEVSEMKNVRHELTA